MTETIASITFFRGVDSNIFLLNLSDKTQNSRAIIVGTDLQFYIYIYIMFASLCQKSHI